MSRHQDLVFVVEDDADTMAALVKLLEDKGLSVVTATNGEQAISQLSDGLRPRLMLIDLMLPKVSGWDVLQYLREVPELSDIPKIVMTAFPRANLRVNADVVLHKPVDYDRLINAVLDLLGLARAAAGG
jgi:two-component system, sensor histidine kinase and response regulator